MIHNEDPSTERTRRTFIKPAGVATSGLFAFSGSAAAHDNKDSVFRGFQHGYKGEEKRKRHRKDYRDRKKKDRDDRKKRR